MDWLKIWIVLGARRNSEEYSPGLVQDNFLDKPIDDQSQDILDRAKFSKALAKLLSEGTSSGSLVVALRGSWGSGKTSIKNMIVGELRGGYKSGQGIIEFSPWLLENSEALSRAFFREIAVGLGHKEQAVGRRSRAEKFRRYAALLTSVSSGVKNNAKNVPSFLSVYASLALLLVSTGVLLPTLTVKTVVSIIADLAGVIALAAVILKYFGRDRARNEPHILLAALPKRHRRVSVRYYPSRPRVIRGQNRATCSRCSFD